MDSEPDEAIDAITRLAAQVLGVPVALVSLVDERRQFFKSQVGLPMPWDERRETPLSHSFCQWVVSSQEELVVSDARNHPVLQTNGAVADLAVVAYAGVPLSAVMGQPIGSFCAIDTKPRTWSDDELAALRTFAQLVDAQSALSLPVASDLPAVLRERHLRSVTRTTARGFQAAAHLLRSRRFMLNSDHCRELTTIVERQSHQLIDVAAEPSFSPAPTVEGLAVDMVA